MVWNPIRKMFYAALEFHGYYQSPDGVTWTRMANQPGAALTTLNCPANPGTNGSNSCTIARGVLAVQPVTGDMFALTVGTNALGLSDVDEGLWRDVCNAGVNGCANPTVQFGSQISTACAGCREWNDCGRHVQLDAGGGSKRCRHAAVCGNAGYFSM